MFSRDRATAFLAVCAAIGGIAGPVEAQNQQSPLRAADPQVISRPAFTRGGELPKYPTISMNRNEQGLVSLSLCVSVKGRVASASIVKSSGFKELDRATLNWAKATQFEPARTADGPVAVCDYSLEYEWKIRAPVQAATPPQITVYERIERLKVDTPPVIIYDGPDYPPHANALHIEDNVRLELCIAPTGQITSIGADKRTATEELRIAAGLWMSKQHAKPAMQNGIAVGVCGFAVKVDWRRKGAR
jgi:TonB family protein